VYAEGAALNNGTFTGCGGTGGGPPNKNLQHTRTNAIGVLLPGNRYILVAGGTTIGTSADQDGDIWDTSIGTSTNAFTPLAAGTMTSARTQATATLLANGKVFIAGGEDATPTPLTSAELFSFNSGSPGSSTSAASGCTLSIARFGHAAVALNGGGILMAGGTNGTSCGTTATNCNVDAYDAVADSCGTTFTLSVARTLAFGEPLLIDGRVIIGGGTTSATAADYIIP
jgi:hypothetical protein